MKIQLLSLVETKGEKWMTLMVAYIIILYHTYKYR